MTYLNENQQGKPVVLSLCDFNAKFRLLSVNINMLYYLVVFIRKMNSYYLVVFIRKIISLCFTTNVFLSNSHRTQGAASSAFTLSEAATRGIL